MFPANAAAGTGNERWPAACRSRRHPAVTVSNNNHNLKRESEDHGDHVYRNGL